MTKTTPRCPALDSLPRAKAARAEELHRVLRRLYPDPRCALTYGGDPFRLLVMGRLSAQCKDSRVNEVAAILFERFPTAAALAAAPEGTVEEIVRPCGVWRVKAKNIREAARIITEDYGGEVPRDRASLMALPGVGEKICNLMLGDAFGDPQIVADTHCIRIANRFALADSTDPSRVVRALEKVVPKPDRADFCHRLVDFGRAFCSAPRPHCEDCPFFRREKGENAEEN